MRILMLVPHVGVRSPMGRIAELLIAGLRDLGCEVETAPWGRHTDDEGVGRKFVGRFTDAVRVRRGLAASQPDCIVVQTSHDWRALTRDLVLVRMIGRRARTIVLQWHGSRADLVSSPGERSLKWATRLLVRRADGVFVLSSEELACFRPLASGTRLEVVSNPFVPLAGRARREGERARSATSAARLLFVARLLPEKGLFDVVDALGLLLERRKAQLVIAGAGPAESELQRRVAARGLDSHVTLAGHLPPTSLALEYANADVFVLPTYHPVEGFPTVIAEAMGAGLPIVTTRMRGITDHLRDRVNALFVPARDPEAVAGAIERLLADDELRKRMGAANMEAVKAFAPDRVARAYLEALHRVADG
jgi:glycosyltransferase involved in cell wall biosynthesis